jgi:hypothetical protein
MASRKGAQGGGGGALSGIRLQSSSNTSKQSLLAEFQLPQMKEKSRVLCPIDKLQESYGKLREAACQSNLWFADLFTGRQKLMHVTPADLLVLLLCVQRKDDSLTHHITRVFSKSVEKVEKFHSC